MNGPEKKVFILALFLFFLGTLVKYSPWDPVPRIEEFSYAEPSRDVLDPQGPMAGDSAAFENPGSPVKTKSRRGSVKKAKVQVHFPLSINRATAEELCAIKGVGPKLAEKIVAFRTVHGPFTGPSDLRKVSGIGEKKAKSLLTYLVFD